MPKRITPLERWLREDRRRHGHGSLTRLSHATGRSLGFLSDLRSGRRGMSDDTVKILAQATGLSEDVLRGAK